jgi:hypothetical protein
MKNHLASTALRALDSAAASCAEGMFIITAIMTTTHMRGASG